MFVKYLSEALKKYYQKQKGRIIFTDNSSLNELAEKLWEAGNFSGVDASILSKVLHGKRLFTPFQLNIFCQLLHIEQAEKEYLFYCLNKDYQFKDGIQLQTFFTPSFDTVLYLETLTKQAENFFYAGKWKDLYELAAIIQTCLSISLAYNTKSYFEEKMFSLYQTITYFEGKGMGSVQTSKTIIQETRKINQKLLSYTTDAYRPLALAYTKSLETTAYYVKGIYVNPIDKKCLYNAMQSAAVVMKQLPTTNNEHVFALRNMAACAITLNDKEVFLRSLETGKKLLRQQPETNFLSSMHLAAILTKGMAYYNMPNPFVIKERTETYFNKSLTGTRIYELSDIKTYLETLIILRIKKDIAITQKIERALQIAQEEEATRHKQVILKLAQAL